MTAREAVWVALLLSVACWCRAQETTVSEAADTDDEAACVECRTATKLITSDAVPLGEGYTNLDLSFTHTRATSAWDEHWSGLHRGLMHENLLEASLAYGVTDNLDVSVTSGYAHEFDRDNCWDETSGIDGPHRGRGMADTSLALKWRFYYNEDLNLSLAWLPGITIPSGTRSSVQRIGTSQEFYSIDQRLAMTKDWGRWTLSADAGYSLPLGDRRCDSRGVMDANVGLGYQALSWLQPEVELNYLHEFVKGGDDSDQLAATAGFVICAGDNVELRVGVQQALAGRNTDKGTSFICAVSFCW